MSKTRHIFFFSLFTLAFLTARGQFAAKDRLLSGGFNMTYSNVVGGVSSPTIQGFGVGFNPQMSIFLSPHFSMGLGLDMSFSHQKWQKLVNNDKTTFNQIQIIPRLTAQYYRPFAEKWYAAVRFDLNLIELYLNRWYTTYSNQVLDSKYKFDSNLRLTTSFTPLIGYRASKHWLIEGQLGVLTLTADKEKTDSNVYSYVSVKGQFRPSLFNFKAIYLWQKKAPSVSKSK
jgi:hypothetical protein